MEIKSKDTYQVEMTDSLSPEAILVLCEFYQPLIGGDGVTAGYIGAGEQTASRFLPDPFSDGRIYRTGDVGTWLEDGSIQFLGRHDRQIKLRSFRIELPEIEQAANSAFALKEAEAVYFRELEKIALFYVPDDAQNIPADAIRSHLKNVLPPYTWSQRRSLR